MDEATKVCSRCGEEKLLGEFNKRARSRDGLSAACRDCHKADYRANPEYHRKRSRDWYVRNQPAILAHRRLFHRGEQLKSRYGITEAEWESLFDAQGRVCAICATDTPARTWHTDHCHTTMKVRGILCHRCNLGLGHLDDDPERLLAAAEYLRRSEAETAPTASANSLVTPH